MKKDNKEPLKINEKEPRGFLVAIGGNEDKEYDLEILTTLLSLVDSDCPKIEVITTATSLPIETGQEYVDAFSKKGKSSVGILNIADREGASNQKFLKRIKTADIIFFAGGDQLRLTSILGGSPVIEEIKRRYREELCIIAGTSAGAAAMSRTMIYGGDSSEAHQKGSVKIGEGIGFIDNIVIDTHFVERGRFNRLTHVVCLNPANLGIGLGEDTGIIIEKGHIVKAIGAGLVVIFDGLNLKYSNVADIKFEEAIAMEHLLVHTIVDGHGFDIKTRKYIRPGDLS